MTRPTKKFDDKWFGPFEVTEKVGAAAYKLKLPKTWKKIHPVFNVALLKPYQEPIFQEQKKSPPPPPILVDDEEEYEVQEVLDSRLHRGKLQYLVKWVGYDEPTWQPASDLEHASEAVQDFHRKHPGAPRRLAIPSSSLRQIFVNTSTDGLTGWSGRPALRRG